VNLKGTHLLVLYTDGGEGEFRLTLPFATVRDQLHTLLDRPSTERPGFHVFSEPDKDVFVNLDSIALIEVRPVTLADVSAVAKQEPIKVKKPPVRRIRAPKGKE
jgi:hypothetical protein